MELWGEAQLCPDIRGLEILPSFVTAVFNHGTESWNRGLNTEGFY